MSIAAYNRGSRAIGDRIDAEARPAEFEVMDILNALPKYEDCGNAPGPLLFTFSHGVVWVVTAANPDGYGFWYKTLHEAVRRWNVTIVGFDCGVWKAERRIQ